MHARSSNVQPKVTSSHIWTGSPQPLWQMERPLLLSSATQRHQALSFDSFGVAVPHNAPRAIVEPLVDP